MAKKKGNEGWLMAGGVVAGLGLLYLLQTGLGKEKNSALIPDTIEDRIDSLVAELNNRFGKRWMNLGAGVLKYYLRNALPAPLVSLVDIVARVENMSKGWMTGYDKRQLAVQLAGTR